METLELNFRELVAQYTYKTEVIDMAWAELLKNYSEPTRHYHNLNHLIYLFEQYRSIESHLQYPDAFRFSIYYHDIIYKATKKDNEEKSTKLAQQRMLDLMIPQGLRSRCMKLIRATKQHELSEDQDTNYLLDIDLAILGDHWEVYQEYFKNVRKEYKFYPGFIYKRGRKKILARFLEMPQIYKTNYYKDKLEARARENISKELKLL